MCASVRSLRIFRIVRQRGAAIPPLVFLPISLGIFVITSCSAPETFFGLQSWRIIVEDFPRAAPSARPAASALERLAPGAEGETADLPPSPAAELRHLTDVRNATDMAPSTPDPISAIRARLTRMLHDGSAVAVENDRTMDVRARPSGLYYVQVGSYQRRSAAQGQLDGVKLLLSNAIDGFDVRIYPRPLPGGSPFFRVQIGPIATQGAALDICRSLRARHHSCFTLAQADRTPATRIARATLPIDWAGIGPSKNAILDASVERRKRNASGARQIADVAPLYTLPPAPGLPDEATLH